MKIFYKLLIIIAIVFYLPAKSIAGESFITAGAVADDFPKVKVFFVATDARDSSFRDLRPTDFKVIDKGYDVSHTVQVGCQLDTVVPQVSVLLVLDKSTSMTWKVNDYPENRWHYVKEAAKLFINTLRFVGETKVAITSFAKFAYMQCNFTNNKEDMYKGMDTIQPYGDTMYNPPFLNDSVGAVAQLSNRPPDIRRIVVFLTDGQPNTSDPPQTAKIIEECLKNNIQVYSITLMEKMHGSLVDISAATGGKAFEVWTVEHLNNIYKMIAIDIQMKQICWLEWLAPYPCDDKDRTRDADITFLRINKPSGERRILKYTAPAHSIATVELSDKIVTFGDPATGQSTEREITLTPKLSPLWVHANGIEINPSEYFTIDWNNPANKPAPPFKIDTGETRKFIVKFTQGSPRIYRQAAMIFKGDPCPPFITLVGGYNQITILSPNGGEIFSTCDSIDILWAGVDNNTNVNLSYSTNSGVTWLPLATNVRGSAYKWMPPGAGTRYKIRATVAPVSSYMCAKSGGGKGDDIANSLAIQKDNLYFYVTGHFEETAKFGNDSVRSEGSKDIFVAKYDRECNLAWVVSAGGPGIDTAAGVVTDNSGNAFITGTCYMGARFGSQYPYIERNALPYCYTAKISPTGIISKVELIGATGPYTTFQATGQKIRFKDDGSVQEIIVQGWFQGEVKIDNHYINDPNGNRFTATYDAELNLKSLVRGAQVQPGFSTDEGFDADGNKYKCGYFENQTTFDSFTLTSAGKKDIYISKYGGTPGSDDQSDKVFTIDAPQLSFKENTVDFGNVTIGNTETLQLQDWLINNGTLPVDLTYVGITGNASQEFFLDGGIQGALIQPGEKLNLPLRFAPKVIGFRNAQLKIKGTCVDTLYLNLIGNGICTAEVTQLIDMGNVNAGDFNEETFECIFKNTNNETINIEPTIEPANMAGDFQITPNGRFPVPKDGCVQMTIKFTPQAPGARQAFINYKMPEACENPKTELRGFGVDANLEIPPIDWKERLVNGVYDSVITITNRSLLALTITNAEIADETGNIFTVDRSALPLEIPRDQTRTLKVSFNPKSEVDYTNFCKLYFQGQPDPYSVMLTGTGILPQLEAVWVCAEPAIPGFTVVAELKLKNLSKSTPLKINLIRFRNSTPTFKWSAGADPANITIPKEGSLAIPVQFTPPSAGMHQNTIIITSNSYDGTYTEPWIDSEVEAKCEGLAFTFPNPFNLGAALLCNDLKVPFTISNDGWRTPITIYANRVNFTGADATSFDVLLENDLTIEGGEQKSFDIMFNPTEERDYNATLHLVNSLDLDLKANIRARGETIKLYTTNIKEGVEPGEKRQLPFKARIVELTDRIISKMKVQISYDPATIKFELNTFSSNLPNWTWQTPEKRNGFIEIEGTGTLQTPFDNELFSIYYTIYLGETKTSEIKARALLDPCITGEMLVQEAEIANVCFIDGRLIKLNNIPFSLSVPEPNPTANEFRLEYGVAFQAHTTIEIINSLGEKVGEVINSVKKPGVYEIKVPVNNLSSGLYLLRMNSGPFNKSIPFVITK